MAVLCGAELGLLGVDDHVAVERPPAGPLRPGRPPPPAAGRCRAPSSGGRCRGSARRCRPGRPPRAGRRPPRGTRRRRRSGRPARAGGRSDPPQDQRPSLGQPMRVVTDPHPHVSPPEHPSGTSRNPRPGRAGWCKSYRLGDDLTIPDTGTNGSVPLFYVPVRSFEKRTRHHWTKIQTSAAGPRDLNIFLPALSFDLRLLHGAGELPSAHSVLYFNLVRDTSGTRTHRRLGLRRCSHERSIEPSRRLPCWS